jgi:hypothetical protein
MLRFLAMGISLRLIYDLDQCPEVRMNILLSEYKGVESMSIGLWSYMSDWEQVTSDGWRGMNGKNLREFKIGRKTRSVCWQAWRKE